MAALQPLAEGHKTSLAKAKSFSQLFSSPAPSSIRLRPVSSYKGEAAVIFTKEDAEELAAPFRLALVGKFSRGRPVLEDIRKFLATHNLQDHVSVGLLDYWYVLIKCTAEDDFNWL